MKKILLIVLVLGLIVGCGTTKSVVTKSSDLTTWSDEELMDRYVQLDPMTQYVSGGVFAAGYGMSKREFRQAIAKELTRRGYVYHPQERTSMMSEGHPEWVLEPKTKEPDRATSNVEEKLPTAVQDKNIVTVNWTFANIRSGAGNNYPVVATVKQGDKLTVFGELGDWLNVRLEDGKEGWISNRVAK